MFLVDVSPSMGKMRSVQLPPGPDGQSHSVEMTNLEWSLQFVMLKIQEIVLFYYRLINLSTHVHLRYSMAERQTSVV